jgi:hypothetical protein
MNGNNPEAEADYVHILHDSGLERTEKPLSGA